MKIGENNTLEVSPTSSLPTIQRQTCFSGCSLTECTGSDGSKVAAAKWGEMGEDDPIVLEAAVIMEEVEEGFKVIASRDVDGEDYEYGFDVTRQTGLLVGNHLICFGGYQEGVSSVVGGSCGVRCYDLVWQYGWFLSQVALLVGNTRLDKYILCI